MMPAVPPPRGASGMRDGQTPRRRTASLPASVAYAGGVAIELSTTWRGPATGSASEAPAKFQLQTLIRILRHSHTLLDSTPDCDANRIHTDDVVSWWTLRHVASAPDVPPDAVSDRAHNADGTGVPVVGACCVRL